MHPTLGKSPLDAGECSAGGIGNATPTVGSCLADPVIERLRAGLEGFSNDNPTYHARRFVRHAVVVIDSWNRERDVEGCAGLYEKARVSTMSAMSLVGLGPGRSFCIQASTAERSSARSSSRSAFVSCLGLWTRVVLRAGFTGMAS